MELEPLNALVSPTPVPLVCAVADAPVPFAVALVAVAGAFGSLVAERFPPLAYGEEKLNTVPALTLTLLVVVVAMLRLAAMS